MTPFTNNAIFRCFLKILKYFHRHNTQGNKIIIETKEFILKFDFQKRLF